MNPFGRSVLEQVVQSLRMFRERGLDGLEQRVMSQREFAALLPLRETKTGEGDGLLRAELERFAAGQNPAFHDLPGLHSARWIVLGAERAASGAARDPEQVSGPLVFAMICDGWPRDVLEELAERGATGLDAILQHCRGYPEEPTPETRVAYLREHRIRSSYFFCDSRQDEITAPQLHASAREIRRALELRKAFVNFVIDTQGKRPAVQQAAFAELQAQQARAARALEATPIPGYPFEPSPFERRLEHEGLWLRRTADIVRTRARRDVRRRRQAKKLQPAGLRQVHAKHYGLMEARVRIREDLPEYLHAGVFVPGAEYEALIRPSATSPAPQPDYMPDGRGLSIKLLDVGHCGPTALPQTIDDGLPMSRGVTQDFALVSNPTFFIRNARDYALLRCLFDTNADDGWDRAELLATGVLFGLRRRHELARFMETLLRVPRHPLLVEYHSMVPLLAGPREAIKLSVRPTEGTRRILSGESFWKLLRGSAVNPNNYLRLALQRSLDLIDELKLELVAHVAGERSMPVEDPTIDWGSLGAKQVVVATIEIARQDATSDQRLAMAERMIFTPWHALADHRPLGSLNRSRLFSYIASAEERRAGVESAAPLWTSPAPPPPAAADTLQ